MIEQTSVGLIAEIPGQMNQLVLGSLPGKLSLQQKEYYANPRNAFWRIMASLYSFDPNLPYLDRLNLLKQQHVGLWDTISEARRPGSLDSSIDSKTIRVNQLHQLICEHSSLSQIIFNGQTSAKVFRQQVVPLIPQPRLQRLQLVTCPSTSPAFASMSFEEKLDRWQSAFNIR